MKLSVNGVFSAEGDIFPVALIRTFHILAFPLILKIGWRTESSMTKTLMRIIIVLQLAVFVSNIAWDTKRWPRHCSLLRPFAPRSQVDRLRS